MKKEIENRADVFFLVDTFYTKIRADDLLGPIFNGVIDDWPAHLERLTDFWETNLFFVNKFKGNPVRKHQEVDAKNKQTIDALHFGVWLNYWMETLETHFTGERAALAKNRARNMEHICFLKSSRQDLPNIFLFLYQIYSLLKDYLNCIKYLCTEFENDFYERKIPYLFSF